MAKRKPKSRIGKVSNSQLGDVVKEKPKTPLHSRQDLNVKDPPKKRVPRPPVQQPNPLDPGEARASDAWEKKAAKANKPPSTATKVASKASKAARLIPLARYATHPYVLGAAALGAVGYGLYKVFSGKSPQNKTAEIMPPEHIATKTPTIYSSKDAFANRMKAAIKSSVSTAATTSATTASTIPERAVDTTLNKFLTRTLLETTKPDIRDDWQNVTPTDTQKAYKNRINAEKAKNRKKLGENITATLKTQPEAPSPKSGGGWLNQAIANALNVPVTPGTEIYDPSTKSGTRTEYPAHQLNPVTSWPKSWNEDRKTAYIEKKMAEKKARANIKPVFEW